MTGKMIEILVIGQDVYCPTHGRVKVDAVDPCIPQEPLYILSCGDIHPTEVIATSTVAS